MSSDQPIYTPFFGAMGATAAMSFSGEWREIVKNIIFTVVLIRKQRTSN